MTRVSCVLRSGGDFEPEHAARLYHQVMAHCQHDTPFVCLTDQVKEVMRLGVPCAHLLYDWPGWWAKMNALLLDGPNLQMDLDITITGDLSPLLDAAARHELIAYYDDHRRESPLGMNSSIMAWRDDLSNVVERFSVDPGDYMAKYRTRDRYGDQAFIRDHARTTAVSWEHVAPGLVGCVRDPACRRQAVTLFFGKWHRPWRSEQARKAA